MSAEGVADKNTMWVNNSGTWVEFNHYDYFEVKKKQNQVSEFEVKIYDITTAQKAYFKEQAEVLFFAGETMILKGRIQTIEYTSGFEVIARGFGMESLLLDKQFIIIDFITKEDGDFLLLETGDKILLYKKYRITYTNHSTQEIAKDINSNILTTASSGIWAADYENISMRFENANRLNSLGKLSEATDYYWWVSQTSSDDYDADYIHFDSDQGETSSQKTYNLTSSMIESKQEKDVTNLVNYVYALGYGDGVNQLETSIYAASTQSSFLNVNIASTDTSILVVDGSIFDATGSVRIAEEIITYDGISTNTLTGCSRGVSPTTAKAHNKNCYIEQHFESNSPQTGSSIQTYGLMDHTLIDKTIIDEETLEVIASGYLSDRKTPILRITIIPDEPMADAALNIGDKVTITDSEADIDSDYRIVGQTYRSDYGYLTSQIECSNRSLEFIEQMNKSKQDTESMAKYMQGATNIYSINEAENCDDSTPLNLRFYLPSEAIAINKVLLNFKMKGYRAYSKNTDVIIPADVIAASEENASSIAVTYGSWMHDSNLDYSQSDSGETTKCYIYLQPSATPGVKTYEYKVRMKIGSDYYPSSDGVWLTAHHEDQAQSGSGSYGFNSGTTVIDCPIDANGSTIEPEWRYYGNDTATHDINAYCNFVVHAKHTHGVAYEMNEETLESPLMLLSVGIEDSETSLGYYDSDQEEIDITSIVSGVGAGNWINIKFEPNKRMRIEANAYIQIFIESK
ncbi:MAG: hypothetical protein ACTSPI_13810 [Candidatus Heimdallarchaeaceae archaeon]